MLQNFPYYAQTMLHYALLIQDFLSLIIYLNYVIMSINSLSSSSTVLTMYQHFEFPFVAFCNLSQYIFNKIITTY